MKKIIEQVATLLMYEGPSINDLITSAIKENKTVDIKTENNMTILSTSKTTAYNTYIKDIFIYNQEKELIKQEICINKKTKVIFDKYEEAKILLKNLDNQTLAVS